ncbi:hypothetical protein QEZ47_04895 [Aminobacter anthyllidis]|uniref:hypothetical protein n=1 Tax=Aminobacter anthyllidis TaxID=1035067 RepID=UPI0024586B16|nr:hypothetical protein [Aminobacter anthyllidis]MDH4984897.1 hypothetical protein [Aminobacter anthyllidis]
MALVLAPAAVPLIYHVAILLGSGYPYQSAGHMDKHLLQTLALTMMNYVVSFALGVPIVVLLYLTRRLNSLNCLVWALIVGAAAGLVLPWVADGRQSIPPSVNFFLVAGFAVIGGLTSAVFCLVAGWRWRSPGRLA